MSLSTLRLAAAAAVLAVTAGAAGATIVSPVPATFIGTVAGNAVVDELDPSRTSMGSVTISPAAGGEFLIDNRATIYGVYTINGGAPITVPVAQTVGAPEASTWAMMLLGFASLGFAGYRRTTRLA